MRKLFLLLLVASLVLVGCGGGSKKAKSSKKSTTTTEPDEPIIAPLTGLEDESGESAGRPALTVKIPNDARVRPQAGLDVADVVYEEIVEGNITRFAAIFNSNVPATIGPIRSVRGMDPNIVWPIGGIFVYSGGAAHNIPKIKEAPVNSIDETSAGDAMFRSKSDSAPFNLFGYGDRLLGKGGEPVPPKALFTYLEDESFAGDDVISFVVGFTGSFAVTYIWDGEALGWARSYGATPHNGATTGGQIKPKNVICQFINYPSVSEGETIGEGAAWVFSNGKVVKGSWKRDRKEVATDYFDEDGELLEITPGQTFVELVKTDTAVTISSPPPTTTVAG